MANYPGITVIDEKALVQLLRWLGEYQMQGILKRLPSLIAKLNIPRDHKMALYLQGIDGPEIWVLDSIDPVPDLVEYANNKDHKWGKTWNAHDGQTDVLVYAIPKSVVAQVLVQIQIHKALTTVRWSATFYTDFLGDGGMTVILNEGMRWVPVGRDGTTTVDFVQQNLQGFKEAQEALVFLLAHEEEMKAFTKLYVRAMASQGS